MPSTDPPLTSRLAHEGLDPDREDDWKHRIVEALAERPATSMHLADRIEESYHDFERRCSALKRQGYVRFGSRVRNPAGNWAYELVVTPGGLKWLETGQVPSQPTSMRDLEVHVLAAARRLLTAKRSGQDLEDALASVLRSQEALEVHQERQQRPSYEEPPVEPYGTERRRELVAMGVWVRQSGETVPLADMNDHHLRGALRWCYRHGAGEADVEVQALQREHQRRLGAHQQAY